MPARLTTEQKAKARKFYIELGYTNLTELAKYVNISRNSLASLRDEEGWDLQREQVTISPQEIARELTKIISEIIAAIKEKRAEKLPVAPSVHKDLVFYTKALRLIDEQYDVKGTLLIFSRMFITFVAGLPPKDFTDKKTFIEDLQKIFIPFIGQIENGQNYTA